MESKEAGIFIKHKLGNSVRRQHTNQAKKRWIQDEYFV